MQVLRKDDSGWWRGTLLDGSAPCSHSLSTPHASLASDEHSSGKSGWFPGGCVVSAGQWEVMAKDQAAQGPTMAELDSKQAPAERRLSMRAVKVTLEDSDELQHDGPAVAEDVASVSSSPHAAADPQAVAKDMPEQGTALSPGQDGAERSPSAGPSTAGPMMAEHVAVAGTLPFNEVKG
jgi:hypothetical protein